MKMRDLSLPQQSSEPQMNSAPFHEAFGENTPNIEPSPLGRFRLVQALRTKFGDNYRSSPFAQALLNHFDSEYDFFRRYRKLKGKL